MPRKPQNTVTEKPVEVESQENQVTENLPAEIENLPADIKSLIIDARNNAKSAVKDYVVGGLIEGLNEVSAGDFGEKTKELSEAVEVFAQQVFVPKPPGAIAASPSTPLALPDAHNG